MTDLLKTPLNEVHRQSRAKMVSFGGWDMPVEYSGLIAEHMAVRTAAGLFDVSHMGQLEVEGEGALAFLQRVTSNNVAKLALGQAQYSSLPMPSGCPVDDIIVYRRSERRYLVVVNASNRAKDWEWLLAQRPSGCGLHDLSDRFALLALQGPKAEAILQRLTTLELPAIGFYRFAEGSVSGHAAIVARTGYTGEDGFEVFVSPSAAVPLWRAIQKAGEPDGLLPAGLGARDTLRLEARMMLYGNDMDETTTLIEAGLGWIGFELSERGIPRHGYPVLLDGAAVGSVTSGTFAPFLQKSIGLCYLPAARAATGSELHVDIRGRQVPARVVPTPFYKRPRH
jgi:aminomethyltransferase